MIDFLFYLFAVLTVVAALLVVLSSNAVNSAMFMIVSFVGTASLFVMLQAYFLAILQVLVYAGAIIVLFLFIIMLLEVDRVEKRKPAKLSLVLSMLGLALLVGGVLKLFSGDGGFLAVAQVETPAASYSRKFGYELFTRYLLPVQVAGFLLLIAMIGVIKLSKRPLSPPLAESVRGESE